MYTYDQVLWVEISVTGIVWHVAKAGVPVLGAKRIDNLGRIASRYRKQGVTTVTKALPELPQPIMDAIIAIAKHQDGFAERKAAADAEREALEAKYSHVGRFE